jgi:hypothetical protein
VAASRLNSAENVRRCLLIEHLSNGDDFRLNRCPGSVDHYSVNRSSGDRAFDQSVVDALLRLGRIPEMSQLDRSTFERMYAQRHMIFKPEDLAR